MVRNIRFFSLSITFYASLDVFPGPRWAQDPYEPGPYGPGQYGPGPYGPGPGDGGGGDDGGTIPTNPTLPANVGRDEISRKSTLGALIIVPGYALLGPRRTKINKTPEKLNQNKPKQPPRGRAQARAQRGGCFGQF